MSKLNSMSEFEKKIYLHTASKRKSLVTKIVSFVLVMTMIIVYFFTPIAKVTNSQVNGNINYTVNQILDIAGIEEENSLYLISKKEIERRLIESPLIKDDSVEVTLSPLGLKINVQEIVPTLKYQEKKYLSDGNVLDSELEKSKDPLVGDHLFMYSSDLVDLFSKPYENNFTKSRVEHLSQLVLSLKEEDKTLLKGVGYDSENYYYNFYYQIPSQENKLLKVVFDSAKKVEDLNVIVDSKKVSTYMVYLESDNTKDKFKTFNEILNGEEYEIKSVKIVMQTIDGEIYYHVKYNNPDSNDFIENGGDTNAK